jgi:hypothetical protein
MPGALGTRVDVILEKFEENAIARCVTQSGSTLQANRLEVAIPERWTDA